MCLMSAERGSLYTENAFQGRLISLLEEINTQNNVILLITLNRCSPIVTYLEKILKLFFHLTARPVMDTNEVTVTVTKGKLFFNIL